MFQIELEFRNLVFWGEGKTRVSWVPGTYDPGSKNRTRATLVWAWEATLSPLRHPCSLELKSKYSGVKLNVPAPAMFSPPARLCSWTGKVQHRTRTPQQSNSLPLGNQCSPRESENDARTNLFVKEKRRGEILKGLCQSFQVTQKGKRSIYIYRSRNMKVQCCYICKRYYNSKRMHRSRMTKWKWIATCKSRDTFSNYTVVSCKNR